MDIERLKELKDMFENERKYNDMHWLSPVTKDDVLELIDEAIDRQLVTSEEVTEAIEYLQPLTEHPIMSGNFAKHIKTAITALKEYQPWIPVSERLPEGDMASVLIYTKEGGVAEGQYYPTIRAWKQFRWSVEDSKVTHWKPLTEPPKGD